MQCKSLWIKASAKCINVNVKQKELIGATQLLKNRYFRSIQWTITSKKTFCLFILSSRASFFYMYCFQRMLLALVWCISKSHDPVLGLLNTSTILHPFSSYKGIKWGIYIYIFFFFPYIFLMLMWASFIEPILKPTITTVSSGLIHLYVLYVYTFLSLSFCCTVEASVTKTNSLYV